MVWALVTTTMRIEFVYGLYMTAAVRWAIEQLYITKVMKSYALPAGMGVGAKGGVTIAVKKRGGWVKAWELSQTLAGWI